MPALSSPTPALETLHAQVWRASSLGSSASPCVSSGFAALDTELPGGGWPTRALTEIISPQHAALEWRLLAPALVGLCEPIKKRPLLLINPPLTPHLPGLQACGLPPQALIWIAADTPQQQLWATEQAIKSNAAAAVLAWLPQARPEQIRRLQACAQGADAPIFLFRPWLAQQQSSAAPLRMILTPGAAWSLDVRVLKRRGPAFEGWLSLPSVPTELAPVLTSRMLALDDPAAPLIQEPAYALARPASATATEQH